MRLAGQTSTSTTPHGRQSSTPPNPASRTSGSTGLPYFARAKTFLNPRNPAKSRASSLPGGEGSRGHAGGYFITHREVKTPGALACASDFSQTGDMTIIARVDGETPEQTCLSVMKETQEWISAPSNPVQCVTNYPNGDGGALLVVPAPEDMTQEQACRALGAALPPDDSP